MYKLKYFSRGILCGSNFENGRRTIRINLQHVSTVSEIERFVLPFSNKFVGEYAEVRMQNGDTFFIDPVDHGLLLIELDKVKNGI
jgi:hypothetical protein